jgi:hypothetical protein
VSAAGIIQPTSVTAPLLAQLGGKARSLYQLGQLDPTRVPAWFAVSADVFADAMIAAGIDEQVTAALAVAPARQGEHSPDWRSDGLHVPARARREDWEITCGKRSFGDGARRGGEGREAWRAV